MANPYGEALLVFEMEEVAISPRKLLGDLMAILMRNGFAVRTDVGHRYFTVTPGTQFILAGVAAPKGSKARKIQEVIAPRPGELSRLSRGIDPRNESLVFESNFQTAIRVLKDRVRGMFQVDWAGLRCCARRNVRFYFARHGESEANVQQVFWNQPGRYGPTIAGRAQAEELADRFAGIAFVALYCSPVLRAVQTAEVVGRWLGLTPVVADGLREWRTGILEGQRHSKETERLHWWATSQWMEHGNHYARIEGGESCDDIKARCVPFVAGLEERYRHVDADLLLISHGGTLRCMLPLLVSNIDDAFALHRPFDYAAPIVVELRNGEWVCLRWGKDDFDTQR